MDLYFTFVSWRKLKRHLWVGSVGIRKQTVKVIFIGSGDA